MHAIARVAWVALLFAWFATAAVADDVLAHAAAPDLALDASKYQRTRTPYWVGMGLVFVGATVLGIGGQVAVADCFFDCQAPPPEATAILAGGALITVAGQVAMLAGVWGNTSWLRKNGVHVPNGFALAATFAPIGFLIGVAVGQSDPNAGVVLALAGAFAPMAFGGGQLAVNKSRFRRSGVAIAPARIGRAPGVSVAFAW